MKELYRFTVDKEIEKEITEDTPEGKLTKKVKVLEPVVLVLKQPSRLEKEEADLFYSTWLAKYTLTYGLPTRAMLTKRYADSGGALSEDEKKRFADLMLKIYEKENEIQRLNIEKDLNKEPLEAATKEMLEARRDLIDFQTYQNTLFQNTAESKAQNKVIYWLVLFLTYTADNKHFFQGKDFDEKIAQYDKMEEAEDSFNQQAIERLFTLWTLFYLGSASEAKDFKQFEESLKDEAKV